MRKLFSVLAAGLLAVGVASQAQAAPVPFGGSLAIALATLPPIGITGTGVANVSGSTINLPASVFASSAISIPVTDPAAFPIGGVQVTAANGVGTFSGGSGPMPINGVAHVCLFGACNASVANVDVPLAVIGAGGTTSVAGLVNVTVKGATWTTGTAAVDTGMGGTATQMGGVVGNTTTLVTPIFISTNIGASAILPAFAILTLQFVPEPGTLMLLGSGIAGLVMFGRSRRA